MTTTDISQAEHLPKTGEDFGACAGVGYKLHHDGSFECTKDPSGEHEVGVVFKKEGPELSEVSRGWNEEAAKTEAPQQNSDVEINDGRPAYNPGEPSI